MLQRGQRVLSFLMRHPLLVFLLGATVLSLVAIFIWSPDGSDPSGSGEAIEKGSEKIPRSYGGNIFRSKEGQQILRENRGRSSSSADNDPERKQEEIERIEARPALQQLPYYDAGIAIDVVNLAPDGKPVIEVVRPMGTSQDISEQIWKSFLEKNNDSEDNYVVLYREV